MNEQFSVNMETGELVFKVPDVVDIDWIPAGAERMFLNSASDDRLEEIAFAMNDSHDLRNIWEWAEYHNVMVPALSSFLTRMMDSFEKAEL